MNGVTCRHCNTTLPDDSRFCLSCGADLSNPTGGPRSLEGRVSDLATRLAQALAGRYEIGRLLGRGGMGAVFLAKDLRLERDVAVKVLPFELASDERFVGRFLREARTAARLEHPNIIPIYAVESQGDLHYFVMRYVSGKTVEDLITTGAGPLPPDLARHILHDAALALGHAHRIGVVHRDVKPSNIMLDEDGRVLLTDFGISKALESATQFTGTGQLVGTPHYMSPEQALGREVTGASDQYSLAVVGYETLTGVLPFEAESPHIAIYKHIHETAEPMASHRDNIPPGLVTAITRGMDKDPANRFRSMEDFARALDPNAAYRSGDITPATTALDRSSIPRAPLMKRRGPRAAIAALVLVLVGGGTWAATHREDALPPAAVAKHDTVATVPEPPQPSVATKAAESLAVAPRTPATRTPAQNTRTPARSPARTVNPPPAPPSSEAPTGFLSIKSTPYGSISVDGVNVGEGLLYRWSIKAGSHTVRITRPGFAPWSATVVVTPGNTTTRSVTLDSTGT